MRLCHDESVHVRAPDKRQRVRFGRVWVDALAFDDAIIAVRQLVASGEGTFGILDAIVDRIVAAIAEEIEIAECNRAILKPPSSLDAWEAYHRGLWHMYKFRGPDNVVFDISNAAWPGSVALEENELAENH